MSEFFRSIITERGGIRSLVLVMVYLLCSQCFAQWTEPVPMTPQFGIGIRSPWISNDGLRLYLCTIADIRVTERDSIGAPWGELVRLPDYINASGTQQSACESPNGDTLYFMSDGDQRPEGGYGWYDIYYSLRTDTGWGPVINCGDSINGPGQEWSVGISRDGGTLLVSSHGSNGESVSHDVWFSRRHPDGTWGELISFGTGVNWSDDDQNPSLSPDNQRLFFSRVGANGGDVWQSTQRDSEWQVATQLPTPVNTFETEMNPCIANDGRTLWFRSERTGQNRIYTTVDTTTLSTGPGRDLHNRSEERHGDLRVRESGEGYLAILLPNPVARAVNAVTLWDVLGRKVVDTPVAFSSQDGETTGLLTVGELPVGTYIVTVRLGDQSLTTKYISLR